MGDQQKRLQMALEAAHMAIWDSRIVAGQVIDGTVIWSAKGAALLGLEEHALTQPFRSFLDSVHASDRDKVIKVLQDGVRRRGGYALQYRVIWPDGSEHWLAAQAQVFMDGGGHPERTLGIIWDVTEHILRELMIAERKELAEVTLSSIGDGVITTDPQGKTRYLNRVAEQLTGWSSDMAQGLDIGLTLPLADERTGEAREHVAMRCLQQRQAIGISPRSQLITREGRRIAIEESAAPIWSRDGEILGAVVVFRDVSHERKLSQQLSWQATHDALTGLINRRGFDRLLYQEILAARRDGTPLTLMLCDLDHFKRYNDSLGHLQGDACLREIGRLLREVCVRPRDVATRYGGEEFALILPNTPRSGAMTFARALGQMLKVCAIAHTDSPLGNLLTLSGGITTCVPDDSTNAESMLMRADQALYAAKTQGRNRFFSFEMQMDTFEQLHS